MRQLAELRGPELAQRVTARSIIIQPIGAIEQHGPHLPLIVDHLIADTAAKAVVESHGDDLDLWLLPAQPVGKSNEHAWSAGTPWLSASTLLAMADDIGRSVATTAARKLVFLNGHGGNSSLLNVACRDIRLAHGLETYLMHPFVPPDQGGASPESELGMGIHGGHMETSVMLHLRPDLVRMDLATRNVPERLASNRHVRFGGTVSFGWLSDDFGPDGHIGDPTGANAEEGKRLFDLSIAMLAEALTEVRDMTLP
jgi:creatinine amidohydrolase